MSDTFKIIDCKSHSQDELIQKLRKVSMLEKPDVYPYVDAQICLKQVAFNDKESPVVPAQRYVLAKNLNKVQRLKWELEKFNINLFKLDGYVTITTNESSLPIDILPPVVEACKEASGIMSYIINDGMHRMYMARLEWQHPQVIFIENVPDTLPYYAYPIPEGNWNEIQLITEDIIPKGFIKKWHRIENNKELYRNFNSAFNNVGGPRGQASK